MTLRLTERSWAIDVCTEIDRWAATTTGPIRSAGGEHGMRDNVGALFPDVLLFGDGSRSLLVQGWELKLPDTPVDDAELLDNAERKATALGLSSFLVWNVNDAVLYDFRAGYRERIKAWHISARTDRRGVSTAPWRPLLREILDDLAEFIASGTIRLTAPLDTLTSQTFAGYVERHAAATRESINGRIGIDVKLRDDINLWWDARSHEHTGNNELDVLANEVLVAWLSKVLLAHVIRRTHTAAARADQLTAELTVVEAQELFRQISSECDFFNVFGPQLAEEVIPQQAWAELAEINVVLCSAAVTEIDASLLQQLLNLVQAISRKMAGQYVTPPEVADLMVALARLSRSHQFIDPCAGTGSIAGAAYDMLRQLGADAATATAAVWASDKFRTPLRLTTLALSRPENRSLVLNVFQHDAVGLSPGEQITLLDPDSGAEVERTLPEFDAIVSNLPFVKQEAIAHLNPGLRTEVQSMLAPHGIALTGKSDLFAYLPFALHNILKPGGTLVILTSNAWTASEWGNSFVDALERFFQLTEVVTSGSGRWFSEVKVVTTILVLRRRDDLVTKGDADTESTNFAVTRKPLHELRSQQNGLTADLLAAQIRNNRPNPDFVRVHTVSASRRREMVAAGVSHAALFADTSWAGNVLPFLRPVNEMFNVGRGERRGWDAMFYPDDGHGIESDYLVPVLLSSRQADVMATAYGESFCCSLDIKQLEAAGHRGALAWIRKFETAKNTKGKPLPDALAKSGHHWYEMRADATADLAISMNPGSRLFVCRLAERSFVNQRLIALRAKDGTDVALSHALLNSAVGLLLIEASGFGRGEGVLDLRNDTVKSKMRMLDPSRLEADDRAIVVDLFKPLCTRPAENLADELLLADRKDFDEAVASAFGFSSELPVVRDALLELFTIRQEASRIDERS